MNCELHLNLWLAYLPVQYMHSRFKTLLLFKFTRRLLRLISEQIREITFFTNSQNHRAKYLFTLRRQAAVNLLHILILLYI